MAEVLSQNEIDALLTAVSDGQVEATPPAETVPKEEKDYVLYDLTSQDKAIRGRLAAFKGIHERFANNFRTTLGQSLKKRVSVKVQTTEFIKFEDYLSNINRPLNISIVECEELKGTILFNTRSSMAYSLVDAYYGGSERSYTKSEKTESFTSIENELIRKFTQLAIKDLEQGWKLNYPLKLKYLRSESNAHFIGSIQPEEQVAVVTCEAEIENLKGTFDIVVQLHPMESIQHALSVNITLQMPGEEELWKQHWLKEILEMEFQIRAVLGQTERTLTEIRQLKTGDVLLLGQDSISPISLLVQDVPKFKGLIGVFRGNNAVRLTKDLSSNDKEESKDGK